MTYKTTPLAHQVRALELSANCPGFAYFMGTGTGKGKVTLDDVARAYRAGEIDTLLIIAPNGKHREWVDTNPEDPGDVLKHLPDDIPRVMAYYESGRTGPAARLLDAPKDSLRILAMNIEALSHKTGVAFAHRFMAGRKVFIALDESHYISTPSAKRTRNTWALGRAARIRRTLSGTATAKQLEGLYAQYRFLDPAIIGTKTYAEFKADYCVEVGQFRKIVGYRNTERLFERIGPYTFQVLREDCLDLLKPVRDRLLVPLSDEQEEIYHSLRKNFLAELDGGEVVEAAHALTRLLRLQQVSSGHLTLPDGTLRELPCPRIDRLVQRIQTVEDPKVIVWARFQPDIVRIGRALAEAGIGRVPYYGPVSAADRVRNLEQWKRSPTCRVLVASDAAATGLNLVEGTRAIFYNNSFSYAARIQKEARIHRIGQAGLVSYDDIYAPGTICERVLRVLKAKGDVAAMLTSIREIRDWLAA